jgi:hypothetical protein
LLFQSSQLFETHDAIPVNKSVDFNSHESTTSSRADFGPRMERITPESIDKPPARRIGPRGAYAQTSAGRRSPVTPERRHSFLPHRQNAEIPDGGNTKSREYRKTE